METTVYGVEKKLVPAPDDLEIVTAATRLSATHRVESASQGDSKKTEKEVVRHDILTGHNVE